MAGVVWVIVFGLAVIVNVLATPALAAIVIQVTSVCPVPLAAQAAL